MQKLAEYIWMDGNEPTRGLRSKSRVISIDDNKEAELSDFPKWGFDGSSTNQADGGNSDLALVPVNFVTDPSRGEGHLLVLCEVETEDGTAHATNSRAGLRQVLEAGVADEDPIVGFEQEYAMLRDGRPIGFPENGLPEPQGPYYCGVGADRIFGRELVEAHTKACLDAGIMIYGVNAEVMPGQWEYQIGYRGIEGENADPLNVADHVIFARYLMLRLGEQFGITPSLDPKPAKGDWNGAGAHTNFSTRDMRDPHTGMKAINEAISRLSKRHDAHIAVYGEGLEDRLTGQHETCAVDQFRGGVADRGASIRIPRSVEERGYGYLEDRRPGANCDPYLVGTELLKTICGIYISDSKVERMAA